jgi:hypothetical protein
MTVTTEEAERLAATLEGNAPASGAMPTGYTIATALRSLAAERDALRAENASLQDDFAHTEEARDRQHTRADALQAENARLREAIEMARECIDDNDVIGAWQTLTVALGEKE